MFILLLPKPGCQSMFQLPNPRTVLPAPINSCSPTQRWWGCERAPRSFPSAAANLARSFRAASKTRNSFGSSRATAPLKREVATCQSSTSVAVAHVIALGPWCERRAELGAAVAADGIRWWGDVVALSGSPLPCAMVGGGWEGSQAQPGWT